MESRGWRSPERDFAVPSPRQIRIRGRGGRVQLPPSSYGKDEFAGAGEYAHPAAHGPYSAFGVLEPGVELKAGTRQDPISKQEHVRKHLDTAASPAARLSDAELDLLEKMLTLALNPAPSILNPQPATLNPQPSTLPPEAHTCFLKRSIRNPAGATRSDASTSINSHKQ